MRSLRLSPHSARIHAEFHDIPSVGQQTIAGLRRSDLQRRAESRIRNLSSSLLQKPKNRALKDGLFRAKTVPPAHAYGRVPCYNPISQLSV